MQAEQSENKPAKVGLVENDDEFVIRIQAELGDMPEIESIHVWETAEAFWRDPTARTLDLLLLDIRLPGMSGVDLAEKVTERDPNTNIVMISNLSSDDLIFQALRNGAIGYLLKSELEDVRATVRTVLGGGGTITPTVALRVLSSFRKSNPLAGAKLTDREKQVLELMVSGNTSAQVAEICGCSINTIHFHAKNIYRKLKVRNRTELTRKAAEAGLLDRPEI